MSTSHTAAPAAQRGPNQAAHRLLVRLIDRIGLSKRAFLDQLADRGYPFSDDDFANWGRAGRSFPRSSGALRAMVEVVTGQHPPDRRCTAAEALQFLGLTGMPFPELHPISALFDSASFHEALAVYLPVAPPPAPPVRGGAFQLERLPPEPEQGAVIGRGLSALADLLWAPEAHEAVVHFRAEFEAACEQVNVLADYKWLHDLFQQLEDRYYLIFHDYRRLPADPSAWAVIERNEPEIQVIADELIERADSPTVAADAARWRQKLARLRGELRASVEAGDAELLARAMTLLKDVLGRELSRINTRLVDTASTLRLHALIAALAVVRSALSRRDLGPGAQPRFAAFEQGLVALARLNERMARVIDTHNAFQEVDDELRRSEALLEHDVSELRYAWQGVRPLLRRLCDASAANWATKLASLSAELEAGLAADNGPRAVRLFRACRSQASRSFNQVDRELLGICEELRQIGEPLATVLKMIV